MYIQMGIQLILEEAAAASPYRLTGKPYLPFRGVAGHVEQDCVYRIPSLTPCASLKGIPTPIATGPQKEKTITHSISHRRGRFMLLYNNIFSIFTIYTSCYCISWSNINNGGPTIGDCEIL